LACYSVHVYIVYGEDVYLYKKNNEINVMLIYEHPVDI